MARKTIMIVIVAVLVLLAVPAAFAASDPASQTPPPGVAGRGREIRAALGLTEDQAKQLKALREQFTAETQDLRQQAKTLRDEVRALLRSADAGKVQIEAKFQELDQVRAALRDKALTHRDAVRTVLTPEQFAKLGDFAGRRGPLGFGPRGPRSPRAPGGGN